MLTQPNQKSKNMNQNVEQIHSNQPSRDTELGCRLGTVNALAGEVNQRLNEMLLRIADDQAPAVAVGEDRKEPLSGLVSRAVELERKLCLAHETLSTLETYV